MRIQQEIVWNETPVNPLQKIGGIQIAFTSSENHFTTKFCPIELEKICAQFFNANLQQGPICSHSQAERLLTLYI